MPILQIHLKTGRSLETKKRLVKEVTDAVCHSLDVPPEQVRIILDEMTPESYAHGGVFHWLEEKK